MVLKRGLKTYRCSYIFTRRFHASTGQSVHHDMLTDSHHVEAVCYIQLSLTSCTQAPDMKLTTVQTTQGQDRCPRLLGQARHPVAEVHLCP